MNLLKIIFFDKVPTIWHSKINFLSVLLFFTEGVFIWGYSFVLLKRWPSFFFLFGIMRLEAAVIVAA